MYCACGSTVVLITLFSTLDDLYHFSELLASKTEVKVHKIAVKITCTKQSFIFDSVNTSTSLNYNNNIHTVSCITAAHNTGIM